MATLLSLRISFSSIALLIHQSAEAIFINFKALFTGHLECEIKWESISIVELKNFIPRKNLLLARLKLR